jgi:hypothetical protein
VLKKNEWLLNRRQGLIQDLGFFVEASATFVHGKNRRLELNKMGVEPTRNKIFECIYAKLLIAWVQQKNMKASQSKNHGFRMFKV